MTAGYVEPLPWLAEAACVGMDPEAFFPERTAAPPEVRRACRNCPVRRECFEWASDLERGEPWRTRAGVYGGATRMQRWRADPVAQAAHRAALAERGATGHWPSGQGPTPDDTERGTA